MSKLVKIHSGAELDAMASVIGKAKISNNGYIWAMSILTDAEKAVLPALHDAELLVVTPGRIYTPESAKIHGVVA